MTMTMARQLGLDRLSAARFSLLLSVPVIGGAVVLKTINMFTAEAQPDMPALQQLPACPLSALLGLSAG